MDEPRRAAVMTVSDGVTNGTRADESGDVAEALVRAAGFDVDERIVVPDERPEIERALRELAGTHVLVVTTGGTGFGPRDVTPEATKAVAGQVHHEDAVGGGIERRAEERGRAPCALLRGS